MLNWNDIILSLLGKANGKNKKLYIEIIKDDGKTEVLHFDRIDENAEAISIKFIQKRN